MRLLFSIECGNIFFVEKENEVYSFWDDEAKLWRFLDNQGNPLPDYERPRINEGYDYSQDADSDKFPLIFNKYGVACGDHCLVDIDGNEIPDTNLNLEDSCGEHDRYFTFGTTTKEQDESISRCGTADGITVDIYDTKNRQYVAKGIPECHLDVSYYDGEPEVILAAIDLLPEYEEAEVCKIGTVIGKKDGWVTVYNFYGNE